jgi:peptide/nickel transport system substrate-binding protein
MRKQHLLLIGMALLLTVSAFAPIALGTGPVQPPVDTSTLYVGEIGWGPNRADPVRAYDTVSGQLIFNVYDTLIGMGTPVTNTRQTWDVEEQYWEFEPRLATNVPARQETSKNFVNTTNLDTVWPGPIGTWLVSDPDDGIDYRICGGVDRNRSGVLDNGDILYILEYDRNTHAVIGGHAWRVTGVTSGGGLGIQSLIGIHTSHSSYNFTIRGGFGGLSLSDPPINFVDETGAVVDTFDVYDAEYSFERGLIQDQAGSPMWMYYTALFGQMNSDYWSNATAMDLAYLIDDAIEVVDANTLRLNLGTIFPDVAFKQILSSTWGSIVSKEFSISIGCWNGNLYEDGNSDGVPDWFVQWRHKSRSPYDTLGAFRYVGTGPYRVALFSSASYLVVLGRNTYYWRGWPAPDRKAYLDYIDIEYIASWFTRRDALKAGQLDVCAVPRANMYELLDAFKEPAVWSPPDVLGNASIKTIKKLTPVLSMEAMLCTFTVDPSSSYICRINGVDAPNFFNDTHMRRAFAYAFNHTAYLTDTYYGEALCRETPLINGLMPDYYTQGPDPPYKYNVNYTGAELELRAAGVWDSGFEAKICYYDTGAGRIAAELVHTFFADFPGTHGTFTATPTFMSWSEYITAMQTFKMPMWMMGWLADFADADNFMRPYMYSKGDFSYFQNYTIDNGWGSTFGTNNPGMNKDELIDLAVGTPDGPVRAGMYADLDTIYMSDVPSYPIVQVTGRRWCKYWVRGWYYNALYPSQYYYNLYKENTPWADVTSATVGVSDGVVDMRDIGYIAGAYGTSAPSTTQTPPYKYPLWAPGTYGYGGCDVYGDRVVDMRDIGFVASHYGYRPPLP